MHLHRGLQPDCSAERARASAACTKSSSWWARVTEKRRRAVPAGTVGGRMAPTRMSCSSMDPAMRRVVSLSPMITGTIWLREAPVSKPRASSCPRKNVARCCNSSLRPGSRSSNANAARAPLVDEPRAHRLRAGGDTAVTAEGLAERAHAKIHGGLQAVRRDESGPERS
jgi:hypothetical protein